MYCASLLDNISAGGVKSREGHVGGGHDEELRVELKKVCCLSEALTFGPRDVVFAYRFAE
jgi:hypothetical protein